MGNLITVQIRRYRLQVSPQPVHVQSDRLQRLAHSALGARELVLLEELLHLLRLLLGRKVLRQILDQTREQEATLDKRGKDKYMRQPFVTELYSMQATHRILIGQHLPVILEVGPGHVPATTVHRHRNYDKHRILGTHIALEDNYGD